MWQITKMGLTVFIAGVGGSFATMGLLGMVARYHLMVDTLYLLVGAALLYLSVLASKYY